MIENMIPETMIHKETLREPYEKSDTIEQVLRFESVHSKRKSHSVKLLVDSH